jgi:hypothetical protein
MRILHHGLGLWPAVYKRVARSFVHRPAAPLGLAIPDTLKCADVLEAVQGRAPSGVALRAILDRFCARRLHSIVGRGEETRLPGRKETLGREYG